MSVIRTILIILVLAAAAGGAYWYFGTTEGGGGTIAMIRERGTLIVGVRRDAPPYVRRDTKGNLEGFEPDLARDLAKRMGVEVEFKPLSEEERVEALKDGRVDLVLAGTPRDPETADEIGFVEPAYYAGGANLLVQMGARLANWKQIEGWPVCAIQGAGFNETVADKFGARIVVFKEPAEALRAFDTGECRALLSDEAWLISLLVQPDYASYDVPLRHIEGHHWFVTVPSNRPEFQNYIQRAVKDWHDSGKIVELERTWNVRPSEFAARMHSGEAEQEPSGEAADRE